MPLRPSHLKPNPSLKFKQGRLVHQLSTWNLVQNQNPKRDLDLFIVVVLPWSRDTAKNPHFPRSSSISNRNIAEIGHQDHLQHQIRAREIHIDQDHLRFFRKKPLVHILSMKVGQSGLLLCLDLLKLARLISRLLRLLLHIILLRLAPYFSLPHQLLSLYRVK